MLNSLLRSRNTERILIFMVARGEGYSTEIARFYGSSVTAIQKQLDNLEIGGIIVNRVVGRTRLYSLNPRYPFLKELRKLLIKTLSFYPKDEQENLLMNRRRPRRRDKPL